VPTKLAVQRFGVIAHHFESAAFCRAFWAKGANDYVAAWLYSASNLSNVGKTAFCCRKEMEDRSVMPEIVGMWFQLDFDDVADQPTHLL
jgi:hypothetical protein